MRWNQQTILDEIRHLHSEGEELGFCTAQQCHPHVLRAALWHYGSWKTAVEAAGFDGQISSKYRRWTRETVLEAIRDHFRAGHDLSWRAVSTHVDPALAAASRRKALGFCSWNAALMAAGLEPEQVARYRRWTNQSVLDEIRALDKIGADLAASCVQSAQPALYNAALRRFSGWDSALLAAKIDLRAVATRRPKPSDSLLCATPAGKAMEATTATQIAPEPQTSEETSVHPSLFLTHLKLDLEELAHQASQNSGDWAEPLQPVSQA